MICTMSKHDAEAKGYADALMFDYRGYVAEATGANIFFVKDGKLHTPIARLLPQRHHAPLGDGFGADAAAANSTLSPASEITISGRKGFWNFR